MKKYLLTLMSVVVFGIILTSCGRSDFEIQGEVRNAIIFDEPKVEVLVRNGVVNLKGTVGSEEAKTKVIETINEKKIGGIKSISNNIEVVIPAPIITTDHRLHTLMNQYLKEGKLLDTGVEISVKNEVITLVGKVTKENQDKLMMIAKSIKNKGVENKMTR